jgi:lactoylglutathione lyase
MEIRIAVVSLWAEDVPASAHFYHHVIGLPLQTHLAEERPHFDINGVTLTIIHGRPAPHPNSGARFPLIAFAIPDLDSAVEKLRTLGVELPWGIENNETGHWVMFHDPAGNLIELVEFSH